EPSTQVLFSADASISPLPRSHTAEALIARRLRLFSSITHKTKNFSTCGVVETSPEHRVLTRPCFTQNRCSVLQLAHPPSSSFLRYAYCRLIQAGRKAICVAHAGSS